MNGKMIRIILLLLVLPSIIAPLPYKYNIDPSRQEVRCADSRAKLGYCDVQNGGCYRQVLLDEGQVIRTDGCYGVGVWQPPSNPLICHLAKGLEQVHAIDCCNAEDFCNANLTVRLVSKSDAPEEPGVGAAPENSGGLLQTRYVAVIVAAILACVMCGVGIFFVARRYRSCATEGPIMQKQLHPDSRPLVNEDDIERVRNFLDTFQENSFSGSGRGMPLLVQRRIARQIQITSPPIGVGRFGQVYKGHMRGEAVAVKIFHSREEKSWFREVEMYMTTMLRHENLLGFIAADNKDTSISTQLWLITEYHENGSLYDYLSNCVVNRDEMRKMARSIANGLNHLHTEITGAPYSKPAVAHQDLKSKNILVKSDLSCCIGDMGLAVRYNSNTATIDIPKYYSRTGGAGTKRCLAPEMLDGTVQTENFDSYKRADIYSLGLVLWEICRRTVINDAYDSFALPYFDEVSPDPDIQEMTACVVIDRKRPKPSPHWHDDSAMMTMVKVMNECWAANPAARLTALRVRKTVEDIPSINVMDV